MIEPQTRYERSMEGPMSDDIGTRAGRRRKVVALYGSYFLLCGATAAQALVNGAAGRILSGLLRALAFRALQTALPIASSVATASGKKWPATAD